MFKKLKEFFSSSKKENVSLFVDQNGMATSKDLQIAATVLLVEIAAADREISRFEGLAVAEALSKQFGVPENEIPELVETAVAAGNDNDGSKIGEFIDFLNEGFSEEQRIVVLSMVWKVIMADKNIQKHEERLATRIRCQLRLTEEQGQKARKMAEAAEKDE